MRSQSTHLQLSWQYIVPCGDLRKTRTPEDQALKDISIAQDVGEGKHGTYG